MFDSLVVLFYFVLNTPLFYLICLFVVIGWMYWVMRRDMQRLQYPETPTQQIARLARTRKKSAPPVARCEQCQALTSQYTNLGGANGERVIICLSCIQSIHQHKPVPPQFSRTQRFR